MPENKTPKFLQQYSEIKRQYPDVIVFFRLGDFYEAFNEDARIAAQELDLTLIHRKAGGQKVPMAGFPHFTADKYVEKLVAKGHKVALCEQIGTEPVDGLIPREVTTVLGK